MPEERKKDPYAIWDRIRGRFTEKQLYRALRNYTCRSSLVYDPEFDRKIKELKPGWFRDPDGAAKKKQELLALAARGEGRPARGKKNKHPLGAVLCQYTRPGSYTYDPVFNQAIRAAAPGWFLDKVAVKKAELLAMAARGEGRPVQRKHPLAQVLGYYANPKGSMYDPVFDQQIKAAAPSWFVDTAVLNKQELLAMAARGEGRPSTGKSKHPQAQVLCSYISLKSRSYDPIFDRAIRLAAPSWFLDTAAMNKQELLAMAARGEGRPNKRKHPWGRRVLSHYTDPKSSSYDPVFDQQIRAAAPGWFERSNKLRKARKEAVNA